MSPPERVGRQPIAHLLHADIEVHVGGLSDP